MILKIVDRNEEFIECVKKHFVKCTLVIPTCGDIFDFEAEAIVSPANSFGFMDGGIDMVYSKRFGWDLQTRLQDHIKRFYDFQELPVGEALKIPIHDDPDFGWLISAPTMRVPKKLKDPVAIRLATRAALMCGYSMETILMPGMGTGVGQVEPDVAALQMYKGYMDFINPDKFPNNLREAMIDENPTHLYV